MEEEKNVETVETVETQAKTSESIEKKGFNITSMVLGIIALLFVITPYSVYVTLPCSIIAIIFSIAGRKEAGRGMGIAGLTLGIISLVILVVLVAIGIWAISTYMDALTVANAIH